MTPAPHADRRPTTRTLHGKTLGDDYAWLKDPAFPQVTDPDILAHLHAENAWFEAAMAPLTPSVDTLEAELRGRLDEADASVPARDGAYDTWWRFSPGGQYREWLRRPAEGGAEEVMLSEPALAEGRDYFRLGGLAVSPDAARLAYAYDGDGSERFTLVVRELATGAETTVATDSIGSPVWSADSRSLAWTEVSAEWRPWRVRLHVLGVAPGDDAVIYTEADPAFFTGIARTQDRRWLVIRAGDHVTSEAWLVPTADLSAPPVLVSARQTEREYDVDAGQGQLFIRVNDTHPNFRIVTADPAQPGTWRELIAGSDTHYLTGLTAFENALVVDERVDGLDQTRLRWPDGRETRVPYPEESYAAGLDGGGNHEPAFTTLRLTYSSMVTPRTVFDFDPAAGTLTPLKVQRVPSGYDAAAYVTRRLYATASDGARVPVSVVHRRDFPLDGSGRLHLYGYGAYGIAIPPSFATDRLSLLDRGFAYAIAHVRGGDDLGRRWYLDGKLDKRTNTFTDFVACARALCEAGYARPGQVSASGGSAGGTLMGAVANTDPALWRAIVAHVPFVDVLNTMLDADLPLTPIEWPEWGNPIADADAFRLLRSYSPYDNATAQAYPAMLVTGGLNDPRVTYWEPAKWVARLRAVGTGAAPLLLKINMGAGHGGKSGRFTALRETAEEYAFLLHAFGVAG